MYTIYTKLIKVINSVFDVGGCGRFLKPDNFCWKLADGNSNFTD